MIALLAVSFVFLGNQRPAHAAVVEAVTGHSIVQGVFCFLDGNAVTNVFADTGCSSGQTSAPSAQLTLVKKIVNTGGGTAAATDWTLKAVGATTTNPTTISGVTGSQAVTNATVQADTYTLSESSGPANYTPSAWSCVGGVLAGNSLTLPQNATVTCTITNTYSGGGAIQWGGLIVKKVVVGSSVSPSTFSFTVNGGSAKAFNANGENDLTLAAGTYSVAETSASNFTPSYSGCTGVSVTAGATTTCTITNTYSGSGGGEGGGGSTSSDLSLTKTVDKSTANVGDHVTYTITVTNGGPADAAGVSVTDVLPTGMTYVSDDGAGAYVPATGIWTVGTLANGAHAVLHIVASVTVAAAGTSVVNSAHATDSNGDPSDLNNTGTASVAVAAVSPTSSDLAISKTEDKTTVDVGGSITYTITVTNAGPATASGVTVTDNLPASLTYVSDDSTNNYSTSTGIWNVGTIGNGGTVTMHIVATVNAGTAGQSITNTAVVADTNGDPNSSNNTAVTVPVTVNTPTTGGSGSTGGGGSTPTTSSGGGNGPIVGSIGGSGGGNGPVVASGMVLGASTSTVSGSCSQYLTGFIKSGQNNDPAQVLKLQAFLIMYEKADIKPTGVFDAATEAATKAFQKTYGADVLTPWGLDAPTGYVYLTTRREVNEIYCHFTQKFPLSASEQAIISAAANPVSQGSGASVTVGRSHKTAPKTASGSSGTVPKSVAAGEIVTASSTDSDIATSSKPSGSTKSSGGFWSHLFGN